MQVDSAVVDRDALIMQHLPQVRIVAQHIHRRLPASMGLDDLISTGIVGLLEAIDRYDSSKQVQLNTFAEHRIRGAILDSLRGQDWAPRETRKRAKLIQAAIGRFLRRQGREPLDEDVAAELGIRLAEYQRWAASVEGLEIASLDSALDDEYSALLQFVPDDPERSPAKIAERSELQRLVAVGIESLPRMERTILKLYYFEEMTLAEISRIVKLHLSRVADLRIQAVSRLRRHLQCATRDRRPS